MSQPRSPSGSHFFNPGPTLNVKEFGANGSDRADDTLAVQNALNAAVRISADQNNVNVNVFFPAGRYFLSTKGLLVSSHITLVGDATAESIIVNSPLPGEEPFVFGTRDWSVTPLYLSIARADDTAAHPPLPNRSYEEQNFIYLKDTRDIQALKNLGVPAKLDPAYAGLKVAIATGATLGNNYGTAVSQDSDPKLVLQKDNGVNPTPVNFGTALAVNDNGKVTLKEPNRLNWGVDAHIPNESLDTYYNPSRSHREQNAITGSAWLTPVNHYHHDITFKNLVFEADAAKTNALYGTYGLYIGFAYNVEVSNCKFRNIPGDYPILAIRTHNVLIKNNQFNVQGYRAITLDAGSEYTISNNKFIGESWSAGMPPRLPLQAINFIEFDENPIDINIVDNQFINLDYVNTYDNRSGQAIAGQGGAYLKVANNKFTGIDRAIVQTFGFNSNVILDNNVIENSSAFLFSGTGASMANLHKNSYIGNVPLREDGVAFDSYNYAPNRKNYAVKNRGVTLSQWYHPTTYVASNYYRDGTPITETALINPNNSVGTRSVVQVGEHKPNPVEIQAIRLSNSDSLVGSMLGVTIDLSAVTPTDFPFYLMLTGGNPDIAKFQKFLLYVPKGKQQATLPNIVLGIKRGSGRVTAKPLCAVSERSASANLRIR